MVVRVLVVRHGERLDEVDRSLWSKLKTPETRHDPPLTQKGWDQAAKAGRGIQQLLANWSVTAEGETQAATLPVVYSSPTVRTLSTAAAVAQQLAVPDVVPVYGLNCCAAAQGYGVTSSGFPKAAPAQEQLGKVALACWPPQGDVAAVDNGFRKRGPYAFVECVASLSQAHEDGDIILAVTHREGIWELYKQCGVRSFRAGYCDVSAYTWDKDQKKFNFVDLASLKDGWRRTGSAGKSPAPCVTLCAPPVRTKFTKAEETAPAVKAEKALTEAAEDLDLAAVLASGSGTVLFQRPDEPTETGKTTKLWRTPGVRGNWVPEADAPNGATVQLLSAPVMSENDEGEFVLIRLACGVEGWTKIKNIQLLCCN